MASVDENIDQQEKTKVEENVEKEKTEERPEWPWKRSKKVAVMLSFSGKNYLGMQR